MNSNEIWLPVAGYENLYEVSNLGQVRSLVSGRVMRARKDRYGYLRVGLYKNGKQTTQSVHRLVATAFLDNPLNLPQVNHKNEVKTDNRASNLEWCDARYNVNYGTRNEQISTPVFQYTMSGEFVAWYPSANEAARCTGMLAGGIAMCANRKRKTYGVYQWSYVPALFLDATEGRFNNTRSKHVYQYDAQTGRFVKEWPSVMEVERQTGWSNSRICKCCNSKHSQAYSFRWFYEFQGYKISV